MSRRIERVLTAREECGHEGPRDGEDIEAESRPGGLGAPTTLRQDGELAVEATQEARLRACRDMARQGRAGHDPLGSRSQFAPEEIGGARSRAGPDQPGADHPGAGEGDHPVRQELAPGEKVADRRGVDRREVPDFLAPRDRVQQMDVGPGQPGRVGALEFLVADRFVFGERQSEARGRADVPAPGGETPEAAAPPTSATTPDR